MSDVAEEVDVESIEHLDFEAPIICEGFVGCESPATLATRCRGCARGNVWCAPCLDRARAHVLLHGSCSCKLCGRRGHVLDDVVTVIPIGGA